MRRKAARRLEQAGAGAAVADLFTGFDWDVLAEAKSHVLNKSKGVGKAQAQSGGSSSDSRRSAAGARYRIRFRARV